MRANRAYELRVNRHGRGLFGRAPDTLDSIEVLEIETGEIALFWDLLPNQTRRMARALRADLANLDAAAFIEKWGRYQAG